MLFIAYRQYVMLWFIGTWLRFILVKASTDKQPGRESLRALESFP